MSFPFRFRLSRLTRLTTSEGSSVRHLNPIPLKSTPLTGGFRSNRAQRHVVGFVSLLLAVWAVLPLVQLHSPAKVQAQPGTGWQEPVSENDSTNLVVGPQTAGDPVECVSLNDPTLRGFDSEGFLNNNSRGRNTTSTDGRYVVFTSNAALVPEDTNNVTDVYLRDTASAVTVLVSVNATGTGSGNNVSDLEVLSADGTKVAFRSRATDLVAGFTDGNGAVNHDVFLRDLTTGTTTVVSRTATVATTSGNNSSDSPVMSADGTKVAFRSTATDLVTGFTDGNGSNTDVFLRDLTAGTTTLISRNATVATTSGNSLSDTALLSADGTKVAFLSRATDLVTGFTDGNGTSTDVFLRDLTAGTTTLVSRNATVATTSGNNLSFSPALSADGTKITFVSTATDLVAGFTDGNGTSTDVFRRDLTAGTTTLISRTAASATTSGNGNSDQPVLSSDGTRVAFISTATDLIAGFTDGNGTSTDIFLRNLTAGTTTLVSRTAAVATTSGNGNSDTLSLSADGTKVAFQSTATDLVTGFTDGNGASTDAFLRDLTAGTTRLVSRIATVVTTSGNGNSTLPLLSGDGTKVAFVSQGTNLVTNDPNPISSVLEYNVPTGANMLVSVSVSPSVTGNNNSQEPGFPRRNTTISNAQGRYVVFTSTASDFGPTDTNDLQDIYWRDLQTGEIRLVSINSTGTGSGNGVSSLPVLSTDGTKVAFHSTATDLVTGFTDGNGAGTDVFLRDLTAGTTTLISRTATLATTSGNNSSDSPVISADGTKVAFQSSATNLVTGFTDGNGASIDIFLRDLTAGTTTLLSRTATVATTSGNNASDSPVINADGTKIAFRSRATNLVTGFIDGNGTNTDVFLRDLTAGTTTLISRTATVATTSANSLSDTTVLSADGTKIAFRSFATDLVTGFTDGNGGGFPDIFLFDLTAGTTTLITRNATVATTSANNTSSAPALSSDGTRVVFVSFATDLVTGFTDGNGGTDVFLRDLTAGTTTLVSRNATVATTSGNNTSDTPVISADGIKVAFLSRATDLVTGFSDGNGTGTDVFLRDLGAGTTSLVSRNATVATTSGNGSSDTPAISPNGTRVAFRSAGNNLIPNDWNGLNDVFVATVCAVTATASNNGPLNLGNLLQLTATGPGGATYSWVGPNGFTSVLQNPTIPNVQRIHSGLYRVTVTSGGCSGSASTIVSVNTNAVASLSVTSRNFDMQPVPGYVGTFTIGTTLTNTGTAPLVGAFFRVTQLNKVGTDLFPGQPYRLRSANNGAGVVGDTQTVPIGSLAPGGSFPVNFGVGIGGGRQPFQLFVDLYAVTTASPQGGRMGHYEFTVNQQFGTGKSGIQFQAVEDHQTASDGSTALISGIGVQTSPVVAVDPANPRLIAVAATDYLSQTVLVKLSQDGGLSWRTLTPLKNLGGQTYDSAQSPSLVFSKGELYVAYIAGNLEDSANAVLVARLSDRLTFTVPTALASASATDFRFFSRPALAVTPAGQVVAVWETRNSFTETNTIEYRPVTATLGSLRQPVTIATGAVGHPAIAATSDGSLLVGWNQWNAEKSSEDGTLLVSSSRDGVSFATPTPIAITGLGAGLYTAAMPEALVTPNLTLLPDVKQPDSLTAVFTGIGNGLDIFMTTTSDGGRTWSQPHPLTNGTNGDQFHPAAEFDLKGNLFVTFYDTRHDITDQTVLVRLAKSTDRGVTVAETPVSTLPANASVTNPFRDFNTNLGTRTGFGVLANGTVVVVWTDTRQGSADIFLKWLTP
ncbi:MAG: hypothetical protein K1Y36_08525 [Blastocatellia bacterium]|nr:hypothetical protein [Blastocatellia bacterium]